MQIKSHYSNKTYHIMETEAPLEKFKRLLNTSSWDVKAMLNSLAFDDEVLREQPELPEGVKANEPF